MRRRTPLGAGALALLWAPAAAQGAYQAPLDLGGELGEIMPRCAAMLLLMIEREPERAELVTFGGRFITETVRLREAAGLPAEEADVRGAIGAYLDAYRATIRARSYDVLDADRASCVTLGIAISNAPD